MSDAQGWTLVGIFAATLLGLVGVVVKLIDAKVDGLRNEMVARFDALGLRLDAIERSVRRKGKQP